MKTYFVSDFHFGMPDAQSSREREQKLVRWLDMVSADADRILIMGDMFDFWFEYKKVVPKGYVRILGKLAELTDKGIEIHLFRGNHDLWAFEYLHSEIGLILHREEEIFEFDGHKFFLIHGDGKGPGDRGFKFLKRVFECRVNQWLFRNFHPDWGIGIALAWSRKHRLKKLRQEEQSKLTTEELPLYRYAASILAENPDIDYFVFGHRHTPLLTGIGEKSTLCIVGNWIFDFSYAEWNGNELELKYFE